MTTRAIEEAIVSDAGCTCCRRPTAESYYKLEYYILPHRLKRKRHRDRERTAYYCRPCVEAIDRISIRLDDVVKEVSLKGLTSPSSEGCLKCGGAIHGMQPALYGLITMTWHSGGSILDCGFLAQLCAACAEHSVVGLPRKLCRHTGNPATHFEPAP